MHVKVREQGRLLAAAGVVLATLVVAYTSGRVNAQSCPGGGDSDLCQESVANPCTGCSEPANCCDITGWNWVTTPMCSIGTGPGVSAHTVDGSREVDWFRCVTGGQNYACFKSYSPCQQLKIYDAAGCDPGDYCGLITMKMCKAFGNECP